MPIIKIYRKDFEETLDQAAYYKHDDMDNFFFFVSTDALRIADDDIIHTVIDFLSYLKLKGMHTI